MKTPKGTFLSLKNARKLSFFFLSAQTRLMKKGFSTVLDLYKKNSSLYRGQYSFQYSNSMVLFGDFRRKSLSVQTSFFHLKNNG